MLFQFESVFFRDICIFVSSIQFVRLSRTMPPTTTWKYRCAGMSPRYITLSNDGSVFFGESKSIKGRWHYYYNAKFDEHTYMIEFAAGRSNITPWLKVGQPTSKTCMAKYGQWYSRSCQKSFRLKVECTHTPPQSLPAHPPIGD